MAEAVSSRVALVNVLRRELAASWRTALGWWLPTAAMVAMTLSMQPQMAEKGSMFEQKVEMMPKALLVAFGIGIQNLADPVFYLATNFTMIQLLGAVMAGLLGSAAIAREEAYGTSELLFALPVARRTVVLGKVAAGLALLVCFDVALLAVTLTTYAGIGVSLAKAPAIVMLYGTTLALHGATYGLALVATVRSRRPRGATSLGLGLVFGLYGIGVVGALSESLAWLRELSPFAHAQPLRVIEAAGVPGGLWVLLAVTAATIAATVALFERKDLHA
jgi:ABC-2 type transport system permease protein